MQLINILFTLLGFGTFVASLPAPAPVAQTDTGFGLLAERDLIEREPVALVAERTTKSPNFVSDVQGCIDSCKKINNKYNGKKKYTSSACKSWSGEIVVELKALITKISAYPKSYKYPSVDTCSSIVTNLLVVILSQLKVFCQLGGLINTLLIALNLVLTVLLGLVGDLLTTLVQLCVLLEAKIHVGICAKIIKGCGGSVDSVYLNVCIQLLVKAGIKL